MTMISRPETVPQPGGTPHPEIFGHYPSEAEIQAALASAARARSAAFHAAFRSLGQFFVAGLALRVALRLPTLSARPALNPC